MHFRNRHINGYNFEALCKSYPALQPFVKINKFNILSINFANPGAVKALNSALLYYYYGLSYWEIPNGYLCPPIPGRADYLYHISDLLEESEITRASSNERITGLDIGTGANCIYPILANKIFNWKMVASDIDLKAIANAQNILDKNIDLSSVIKLRVQPSKVHVFNSIIQPNELFDFCMCNPPFHSSAEAAFKASMRKVEHLQRKKIRKPILNFGGCADELWTLGGEKEFVKLMITESKLFAKQCFWFTTLISKQEHLGALIHNLNENNAINIRQIEMTQGQKNSRILAWSFFNKEEQKLWQQKKRTIF